MKARVLTTVAALAVLALGVAGCGGPRSTAGGSALPVPGSQLEAERFAKPLPFQLVGYWDGWQNDNLTATPSGVTQIPIAFGYLHGHTIVMSEITPGFVTAADIRALHARGVKVTLSLGGWSPNNAFTFDGDVAGFEASLQSLHATLPFDGVDLDDEHGTHAQRIDVLSTLIPAARTAFNGLGMPDAIVTYTAWNQPTDYGDDVILKDAGVIATLSWVNVMSYQNNDVARTEKDLAAYAAIFPASRLMMGVDIDDAPIPTVTSLQTLTNWAKANGYGGMMAWTVNGITAQELDALTGQ